MFRTIDVDLIIFGGGIAGLWTLNRVVQSGYNAILLEKNQLGGGQTICSQGIIHGGIKYALNGMLTSASNAIREMPAVWEACLDGSGPIDLTEVEVLSRAHYLWSKQSISARMAAFFASRAVQGRISHVPSQERPDTFRNNRFRGSVYRLHEFVMEVHSLVQVLAKPVTDRIFHASPEDYVLDHQDGTVTALKFPEHAFSLRPKKMLFCCGEGYEELAKRFSLPAPEMQLRSLHMVMVKFDQQRTATNTPASNRAQGGSFLGKTTSMYARYPASPLYAHCLSGGTRPLVTITTHYTQDRSMVWYLGGEIAESGTKRNVEEQVDAAKSTLEELLPWVDFDNTQWATLQINRAEPKQSTLTLPDSAFAESYENFITAWPTKLALAPDLAEKVLSYLPPAEGGNLPEQLSVLPTPSIATTAWEEAF